MTTRMIIEGHAITVDTGMAEVVRKLNECGYRTVASCSSLREDHPSQNPKNRSDNPYVRVAGKRSELIGIAEASGWGWMLEGKSLAEDGKTPIDHVNFFSTDGQVYRAEARVLKKPEIGPDGKPVHWRQEEIRSSKEEAIQSLFPVESTQLTLDIQNAGNDEFIRQRTARLLEVITETLSHS